MKHNVKNDVSFYPPIAMYKLGSDPADSRTSSEMAVNQTALSPLSSRPNIKLYIDEC
jgi:hypothetical protein